MEEEQLELTDVSNSSAFKVLEELVADGSVDSAKAEAARLKFTAIHDALIKAMANEQSLLEKAKDLKSQVEDQTEDAAIAAEPSEGDTEMQVAGLKEDLETAKAEVALCDEREQLQQLEVIELQRQRNELQADIDKVNEEHRSALEPQIQSLEQEITRLQLELNDDAPKLAETQEEAEKMRAMFETVTVENTELIKDKRAEDAEVHKWSSKPEKLRRQTDILTNTLKGLRAQVDSAATKQNAVEVELQKLHVERSELEEKHSKILAGNDKSRVQNEGKERTIDDIRKDLELACIDNDQLLANQVNLDLQIKGMGADLKREMDILARSIKDKDSSLRKYKKAENALQLVEDQIPPLKMSKEQLGIDKTHLDSEQKKAQADLMEVKREVDVFMSGYLKEETVGKEKAELFALSFDELNELEAEVVTLKGEELERERHIKELAIKRDNASRQVSVSIQKQKESQELVKMKELVGEDLKKARRDTVRRVKDFQQLYELVKNQRNKFVNLIQAANQSCAEMREKLKILGNEVEILRNESTEKDKLLSKERTDHSATKQQRDAIRGDLNKCSVMFRKKQEMVDEQILEMDKLNALINAAEKEMLRLKKQYETVVESRNFTGIMLIDRNDELCILYEKANIQEEVHTSGTMSINKLEDEVRILNLECREVERSIHVTRKLLPTIPMLDENVALLQKELLEARRESEKLSLQLEDPENKGRWRRLDGKIPTSEELQAKMNQLDERLNDKKEQLLEKELILEEITSLSDRLRQQAGEGRADTLELAKKVNDYQNRIRAVTRKLMATISELSMYQATAIKLGAERDDLADEAQEATVRLESGEAPTAEAEREWFRQERERITVRRMQEAAMEAQAIAQSGGNTLETTADPRPNAYIPEQLGIPKPYGNYHPFKPQEPGSTMRHIRRPQPKEIII